MVRLNLVAYRSNDTEARRHIKAFLILSESAFAWLATNFALFRGIGHYFVTHGARKKLGYTHAMRHCPNS
ncbi:hypothetical protein CBM2597_U10096 [Cupriavidus taiwanensis]|uniref:Uncharacterized protein n=1 Tax=Cupriavidus taiwanensis TaxID=164546 RepID=A0A7Z7JIN8_9BURK|nr:hypothetical protein CBM2597_U10096 [Cupriavidus taiwanensis]SPC25602.1 hypothetical protein CBM2594_U10103 [Cupriavidus taiwanensis]